jgi:hypothetical protein
VPVPRRAFLCLLLLAHVSSALIHMRAWCDQGTCLADAAPLPLAVTKYAIKFRRTLTERTTGRCSIAPALCGRFDRYLGGVAQINRDADVRHTLYVGHKALRPPSVRAIVATLHFLSQLNFTATSFSTSSVPRYAFAGSFATACHTSPCRGSQATHLATTSACFSSVPCCSKNL